MDTDKILELEERIRVLEEMLKKITFSEVGETKEIILTNCSLGEIIVGNNQGKIMFQQCDIGACIDGDINETESRLDEAEDRLQAINDGIDGVEERLDELEEPGA